MIDPITFDLGTTMEMPFKLADTSGLAPLELPQSLLSLSQTGARPSEPSSDAIARFQAAMGDTNRETPVSIMKQSDMAGRVVHNAPHEQTAIPDSTSTDGMVGRVVLNAPASAPTAIPESTPADGVVGRVVLNVPREPTTTIPQSADMAQWRLEDKPPYQTATSTATPTAPSALPESAPTDGMVGRVVLNAPASAPTSTTPQPADMAQRRLEDKPPYQTAAPSAAPTTAPTAISESIPTDGVAGCVVPNAQASASAAIPESTPADGMVGRVVLNAPASASSALPESTPTDGMVGRVVPNAPTSAPTTTPEPAPADGMTQRRLEDKPPYQTATTTATPAAPTAIPESTPTDGMAGRVVPNAPATTPATTATAETTAPVDGLNPIEDESSPQVLQAVDSAVAGAAAQAPDAAAAVGAPVSVVIDPSAATARTNELVEAASAVADTIQVTPSLMRGDGEVLIRLKPTVLDGSEMRLEAKGTSITLNVVPSNAEIAQIVERSQAQFVQQLTERLPSFQFAVSITPRPSIDRKTRTDETA